MGRTKRRRTKSKQEPKNPSLNHEQSTINLRKWLKQNGFADPLNLELRNFPITGRGVTSRKPVQPLDTLMRVPFDLLITFDTVRKSELPDYLTKGTSLTIQTLLALFLLLERHKTEKSSWKRYLDSLPFPEPVLPWMCQEVTNYPQDLRESAAKLQGSFEQCYEGATKALLPSVLCQCCGKPGNFLLDMNLFKWAYVMVNTRAVYVDPNYIMSPDKSRASLVADEPFLALCPFLDLINHHYLARTKATIIRVDGRTFYELSTMTGFKKHEEFFISYGAHSNEKLLLEYGFFIPQNVFDSVRVGFKEVLEVLKISLDERQYKSIRNYQFEAEDLYINHNGVSFVLRAVLFVGFHPKILDYSSFIFSNRYPSDFGGMVGQSTKALLNFKLEIYKRDALEVLGYPKIVADFLNYRVDYVQGLLELLDENKLCFS